MLGRRLELASATGLVSCGTAHRVGLAARLANAHAEGGGAVDSVVVSGQELAEKMGLSRAAVHKHVRHLQALGFDIKAAPSKGYRLGRPFTDLVAAEAVLPFLLGVARFPHAGADPPPSDRVTTDQAVEDPSTSPLPQLGLPYVYLEHCESTNLVLREALTTTDERVGPPPVRWTPSKRAMSVPPSGTVVVTDEQTAGRGRLSRSWSSRPRADLTFSTLMRPSLAPGEAHLLSLAAGLAIAGVLEALPGFEGEVTVKWPNDVLLGEKKVCGILLEGSMDAEHLHWVVVGIGLNVNSTSSALMTASTPEEAAAWAGRPRPVSLREHLGGELPRAPLLASLLEELCGRWKRLEGHGSMRAEILEELRRRDALAGRLVEVSKMVHAQESTIVGEAQGFGPEGQLLVRQSSGRVVPVFAGDVSVRTCSQV